MANVPCSILFRKFSPKGYVFTSFACLSLSVLFRLTLICPESYEFENYMSLICSQIPFQQKRKMPQGIIYSRIGKTKSCFHTIQFLYFSPFGCGGNHLSELQKDFTPKSKKSLENWPTWTKFKFHDPVSLTNGNI